MFRYLMSTWLTILIALNTYFIMLVHTPVALINILAVAACTYALVNININRY